MLTVADLATINAAVKARKAYDLAVDSPCPAWPYVARVMRTTADGLRALVGEGKMLRSFWECHEDRAQHALDEYRAQRRKLDAETLRMGMVEVRP